jgi:RNase H-fold protein (predicted Holliday junction resolvase)
VLLSVAILIIAFLAFAAENKKPELRPAQVIMQTRAASLTAIKKDLETKNFKTIVMEANNFAAETKKTAEKIANPLGKEITLAIAILAKDTSTAATKGDAKNVKMKLGEIKAKCDECHTKIRDKDKK